MSRRVAGKFESEEAEIVEESWEETFVRTRQERVTRGDLDDPDTEHFLYESGPVKTYRLVYDPQAESVRLDENEPEEGGHFHNRTVVPAGVIDSIAEIIGSSRRILSLEDNWDEEGSVGYSEHTWIRATDFVRDLAINYWTVHHSLFIPPRILPGPEGSIDIHWRASGRELLINIPANEAVPAGYYGSGDSKENIKGKLDTSKLNLWILTWLLQ